MICGQQKTISPRAPIVAYGAPLDPQPIQFNSSNRQVVSPEWQAQPEGLYVAPQRERKNTFCDSKVQLEGSCVRVVQLTGLCCFSHERQEAPGILL